MIAHIPLFSSRYRRSRRLAPLLVSDAQLQNIHLAATQAHTSLLNLEQEVRHILLGERHSSYAGDGYEFAENISFQAGDNPRFINWRLYARTGEYFRKTFYEERRPQLWLIIDRGPTMCYGTRTRLKVALAAELALYHLFLAQTKQLQTGAVFLDQQIHWIKPLAGGNATQNLIFNLRQPCPPPSDSTSGFALDALLAQLWARLAPGCVLIFYSDFHNYQANNINHLHRLCEQHKVVVRHIIDRTELALPPAGCLDFIDASGIQSIDCQDPYLQQQYRDLMQERHQLVATGCRQAGCDYQRYLADDELFTPVR